MKVEWPASNHHHGMGWQLPLVQIAHDLFLVTADGVEAEVRECTADGATLALARMMRMMSSSVMSAIGRSHQPLNSFLISRSTGALAQGARHRGLRHSRIECSGVSRASACQD